jgi:hypothetical protein
MANSYFSELAQNPHQLRRRPFGAYLEDPPSAHAVRPRTVTQQPPDAIEDNRARAPKVADAPAFDPIKTALEAYQAKVPTTTKGKIIEALKTAGLGALQAAAQDRENPLGAAIGGAAAGGAIGAVSPRTGRAFQFETIVRPRIEDRLRREEEQRKRQEAAEDRARAISQDDLKRQDLETDIDLRRSQAQKNRTPEPSRAIAPHWMVVTGDDGQPAIVDLNAPQNQGKIFRPYIEPPAPKKSAKRRGGQGQSNPRQPGAGGGATPEQIQQIISEAERRGQKVTEEQVRKRLEARRK